MKKKKKIKKSGPRKLPGKYRQLIQFFQSNPRKSFNYKQITFELGITSDKQKADVVKILEVMEKEEIIEMISPGKYRYIPDYSLFTGIVEMTQRGAAFVIVDDLEEDIYISKSLTGMALNGDTVTVELTRQKKGSRLEGKIIEVVERHRNQFVGTVQRMKKFAFVIPDNPRIHVDFFVPIEDMNGARDGDKVKVELNGWPIGTPNPFGKVVDILGKAGEHNTEMHAILSEFGFETEFAANVLADADGFPDNISSKEIAKRRDERKTLTFTIDPVDAKDFDDAISYKKLDNGNYEVGVHIADVSHFVRPNSALDDEALRRATSVYLVDRTVPMLPERISNHLCSLKPKVDRLAFAVIFELNEKAEVLNYWIGKTVIHSNRRFSYEEAQEVIEGKSKEYAEEITTINKLAHALRDQRYKNGAISFESDEFRFTLDENGKPIEVIKKVRKDAHKMIEDFMLLANKTVAKHVHNKIKKVLPYRVHAAPNVEKMAFFIQTAKKFGYEIKTQSNESISSSINEMVEKSEGKIEANILHPLAIRSMEKAIYTTKDTYHFGLNFSYYTHFTSPIRRYPDLIVHRLLFQYLEGRTAPHSAEEIEEYCKHSSQMEQKATQAERASVKYKQIEYLSDFIGDTFEGIISGVTEWGIFVELKDNHCEGMIRISDMKGDFYEFYEKDLCVIGRRTGKKYNFGDTVRIRIKKTNMNKRTADFTFVSE